MTHGWAGRELLVEADWAGGGASTKKRNSSHTYVSFPHACAVSLRPLVSASSLLASGLTAPPRNERRSLRNSKCSAAKEAGECSPGSNGSALVDHRFAEAFSDDSEGDRQGEEEGEDPGEDDGGADDGGARAEKSDKEEEGDETPDTEHADESAGDEEVEEGTKGGEEGNADNVEAEGREEGAEEEKDGEKEDTKSRGKVGEWFGRVLEGQAVSEVLADTPAAEVDALPVAPSAAAAVTSATASLPSGDETAFAWFVHRICKLGWSGTLERQWAALHAVRRLFASDPVAAAAAHLRIASNPNAIAAAALPGTAAMAAASLERALGDAAVLALRVAEQQRQVDMRTLQCLQLADGSRRRRRRLAAAETADRSVVETHGDGRAGRKTAVEAQAEAEEEREKKQRRQRRGTSRGAAAAGGVTEGNEVREEAKENEDVEEGEESEDEDEEGLFGYSGWVGATEADKRVCARPLPPATCESAM